MQNALNYAGGAQVSLARIGHDSVTLLVEDNGPGMPAEELERIFHPFYHLEGSRNRETGRVGLDLPIVRNILRALAAT